MTCEVEDCKEVGFRQIVTEYSCFGNEYMMLCRTHLAEHYEQKRKPVTGYCERCNTDDREGIRPFQDPEEGSAAAYLDTCEDCRSKIMESFCE